MKKGTVPSYAPIKKPSVKKRGFKPTVVKQDTYADILTSEGQGKTTLEQLAFSALKSIGVQIDETQKYIPLQVASDKSIADFWINSPPTAIYVDGPVHDFREEVAVTDKIQQVEMEGMGIKVVRLNWKGLMEDPNQEARKVLYG